MENLTKYIIIGAIAIVVGIVLVITGKVLLADEYAGKGKRVLGTLLVFFGGVPIALSICGAVFVVVMLVDKSM